MSNIIEERLRRLKMEREIAERESAAASPDVQRGDSMAKFVKDLTEYDFEPSLDLDSDQKRALRMRPAPSVQGEPELCPTCLSSDKRKYRKREPHVLSTPCPDPWHVQGEKCPRYGSMDEIGECPNCGDRLYAGINHACLAEVRSPWHSAPAPSSGQSWGHPANAKHMVVPDVIPCTTDTMLAQSEPARDEPYQCLRELAENLGARDTILRLVDEITKPIHRELEQARAASPQGEGPAERFTRLVMNSMYEGGWGTLEGLDIEEFAEKCGIIKPTEVTEPCCEDCLCALLGDFPVTCNKLTAIGKAICNRQATTPPPSGRDE